MMGMVDLLNSCLSLSTHKYQLKFHPKNIRHRNGTLKKWRQSGRHFLRISRAKSETLAAVYAAGDPRTIRQPLFNYHGAAVVAPVCMISASPVVPIAANLISIANAHGKTRSISGPDPYGGILRRSGGCDAKQEPGRSQSNQDLFHGNSFLFNSKQTFAEPISSKESFEQTFMHSVQKPRVFTVTNLVSNFRPTAIHLRHERA